jgi:hypothetical protein
MINEFLYRELSGLLNLSAILWLFAMLALMTLLFGSIYLTKGVEYFDARYSEFEQSFLKKWGWYCIWALAQQIIVFSVLYMIPVEDVVRYLAGVALFSVVFHVPNLKLMAFTFAFSLVFYYAYFYAGFTSLILMAIAHGFGGTLYYKLGWNMRVWRFNG